MSEAFEDRIAAAEHVDPLQNRDAEVAVLGDLIADNRLIDGAADICRPVDFSVPLHQAVYAQLLEHSAERKRVDAVTLAPILRNEPGWGQLNRILAAADLNSNPPATTKAYLEQIAHLSSRRRMVLGLQEVITAARALDTAQDELVTRADEAIAEISDASAKDEQAPAGEYAQRVVDSFGKPIVGVRCGTIRSLDSVVGTLCPPDFLVEGARPGMAKTATACGYALGAAMSGHPVIFFSLEMSADQLTRRMLADMCHSVSGGSVQYADIRDGTVTGADLDRVLAAKRRLDALPIEIAEPAGLTLAMLKRRVRRHKRRLAAKGLTLQLVIIDYLQLMAPSRAGMSLYEQATEISKGLKALARSENVVVFALAQLSREVEKRPDKRPMPSDLRDSGQIEQDADVILLLYREEEYLRRQEPADHYSPKYEQWRTDMEAVKGKIEFIVAKRRSGPTGNALGWFFGEYTAVRGSDFYSQDDGGRR